MKIEIEVALSKDYYHEVYSEWLKFRSKGKRWQVQIGLLLFCVALLLIMLSGERVGDFWIFPFLFVLAGIYEISSFYYSRWQWLHSREVSYLANQKVALTFEPHVIHHTGPFSHGALQWNGIQQVQETAKGIFLIPHNGISIYLPKRAFQSATQIQEVLNQARQRQPQ